MFIENKKIQEPFPADIRNRLLGTSKDVCIRQDLRNKPVAKPADRNDMLRALFIFFNLSAQTIDIDHDRIVINGNRIAPDMFIDHIFGKYLLRVFQEEKKKLLSACRSLWDIVSFPAIEVRRCC